MGEFKLEDTETVDRISVPELFRYEIVEGKVMRTYDPIGRIVFSLKLKKYVLSAFTVEVKDATCAEVNEVEVVGVIDTPVIEFVVLPEAVLT